MVELKPRGVAEAVEAGKSRGKGSAKSPADVHQMVLDYGDLVTLDAWIGILVEVSDVPANGLSSKYWSTAIDWVEELILVRERLVAAAPVDAEVAHLSAVAS
jgi:hypothetical protein